MGGHFGRAKASPAGLELGHASPAVLTSGLGQDSKITWLGKGTLPKGKLSLQPQGADGAQMPLPSTSHGSVQSRERPPG